MSRYLRLFRFGGDLTPKPMGGSAPTVSDEQRGLLKALVDDDPSWSTTDLAAELNGSKSEQDTLVSRHMVARASAERQL